MKKRALSIILALLLTAPTLVACSGSTENAETENITTTDAAQNGSVASEETAVEEETEEEGYLDDLPEITFNGSDFVIYNGNELSNTWWLTNYIDFTEDSADALESAIYHRNRSVEERFDILISETIQANSVIKEVIAAGDGAGVTRGLSQAGASGVYVARTILSRMG